MNNQPPPDNSLVSSEALRDRRPVMPPARHGRYFLKKRVRRLEKTLILKALDKNHGNKTRTAAELGLSRVGLYKKLKQLSL